MRSLPAPNILTKEFFLTCISGARPPTRVRLEKLADAVESATSQYERAAARTALHELTEIKGKPDDHVDREELKATYKSRMVPGKSPGHHVYNQLKSVPRHGICPLCGQRLVETLDHQLPKSHFPLLAVSPTNLVPACSSCNWIKSSTVPERPEEQTLNPYFDDVSSHQWVFATVNESETAPPSIRYYVKAPAEWNRVLAARIDLHFRTFGLADLYGAHAAQEISGMRFFLGNLDSRAMSHYLGGMAESIAANNETGGLNHWRRVMYQALASSSWFVAGGYKRF